MSQAGSGPAQLIGDRVAAAAAAAVRVDGVSLAAAGSRVGLAVPIGASSAAAALVEQWEFTVGQGPGIDAYRDGRPVIASGAVLARRWPVLHEVLASQTPFQSMVGLPLPGPLTSTVTIGLLFRDASAADHLDLPGITSIATLLTAALIRADVKAVDGNLSTGDDRPTEGRADRQRDRPAWLSGPLATGRRRVMMAAGKISWQLHVPVGDAVTMLRARAYSQRSTADDLAAAIISGAVQVTAFDVEE